MELDRGKRQLLCDLSVLDRGRLSQVHSLDELCDVGAAGDCGAAAKGLELGLADHTVLVHLNLKLHHITACWRANNSRAN